MVFEHLTHFSVMFRMGHLLKRERPKEKPVRVKALAKSVDEQVVRGVDDQRFALIGRNSQIEPVNRTQQPLVESGRLQDADGHFREKIQTVSDFGKDERHWDNGAHADENVVRIVEVRRGADQRQRIKA